MGNLGNLRQFEAVKVLFNKEKKLQAEHLQILFVKFQVIYTSHLDVRELLSGVGMNCPTRSGMSAFYALLFM